MAASDLIQLERLCIFGPSHDLTLPTEHSSLQRKNFVYRMLFTDIYYLSFMCYMHFVYLSNF